LKSIEIGSDSVGIIHNEGLDYIIERYNTSSCNIDSIFYDINVLQKEFFKSKGYISENLSSELKYLVSSKDGISWINYLYNNKKISISIEFKGYLIDILTYTYKGIDSPFSQVNYYAYLDSVHSKASSILSTSEIELLARHISVAKSSFEYWFNNDGTPKNIKNNSSKGRVNWWEVLGVDCIGGLFGGGAGFLGSSAIDAFVQWIN